MQPQDEKGLNEAFLYEKFMENLNLAHIYAERALDALYEPGGPKRSIWYRMAIGRAQNTLIGLYVRELARNSVSRSVLPLPSASPPSYTPGSENIGRPSLRVCRKPEERDE